MLKYQEGDIVTGLAAFPDRDSEIVTGEYIRTDDAGVVVNTEDSVFRTIIERTAQKLDTGGKIRYLADKNAHGKPRDGWEAVRELTEPGLGVRVIRDRGPMLPAEYQLTIEPNHDLLPRVDLVYTTGSQLGVVVGLPGRGAPGAPAGAQALAEVTVGPFTTYIRDHHIRDRRTFAVLELDPLDDPEGDAFEAGYLQAVAIMDAVGATPDLSVSPREAVLTEARGLIVGDRNHSYGSPTQNFTNTAEIWTALLRHKLRDGEVVTATEVGTLMVGLKLARTVAQPKRDNFVDMAGYAGCAWETIEEAQGGEEAEGQA